MNRNKTIDFILRVVKTIILPILVIAVFAVLTNGRSASKRMLLNTIRQSIVPMLLCWGLMASMSMGMMNFTAGATLVCAGIIGGNLAKMVGWGVPGLILFCTLMGLLIGLVNGLLYNKLRVPCMVLTIGLMLFYEALPRAIFAGGIRLSNVVSLSMAPNCYYVAIVMFLVFYYVYELRPFGHNIRAIGASPVIANNIGLDADKLKLRAFILSGLYFGVAAAVYVSASGEVRNVNALGSMLTMMDAFMGMFLALFLSQFCSTTIAVVVSTFTMKMISNGLVAMGMDATVRELVNGVFLLVLLSVSANAGLFERIKADKAFKQQAEQEYAS